MIKNYQARWYVIPKLLRLFQRIWKDGKVFINFKKLEEACYSKLGKVNTHIHITPHRHTGHIL